MKEVMRDISIPLHNVMENKRLSDSDIDYIFVSIDKSEYLLNTEQFLDIIKSKFPKVVENMISVCIVFKDTSRIVIEPDDYNEYYGIRFIEPLHKPEKKISLTNLISNPGREFINHTINKDIVDSVSKIASFMTDSEIETLIKKIRSQYLESMGLTEDDLKPIVL